MSKPNPLQMKLLEAVNDAGGRECTETLYDMVEAERPTHDEDGEGLDDMDPYETSREEIGSLESDGFLDHDENGMAGFGYSSLTDKGREALGEGSTKEKLATAFRELLARDLTADELLEMDNLNRLERDGRICHSHDFLDSNMTMNEAFTAVMGREADLESRDDTVLWSTAWDRMKEEAC